MIRIAVCREKVFVRSRLGCSDLQYAIGALAFDKHVDDFPELGGQMNADVGSIQASDIPTIDAQQVWVQMRLTIGLIGVPFR
jgi:hypothetical protein